MSWRWDHFENEPTRGEWAMFVFGIVVGFAIAFLIFGG